LSAFDVQFGLWIGVSEVDSVRRVGVMRHTCLSVWAAACFAVVTAASFTANGGDGCDDVAVVASVEAVDLISNVVIEGDRAYLNVPRNFGPGNFQTDFEIYDISDPRTPVFLGRHIVEGGSPRAFDARGDLLYVFRRVGFDDVLDVVDVSDPASAVVLGSVFTSFPESVTAAGDKLVGVFEYDGEFGTVIDITDPTDPRYIQNFGVQGSYFDQRISVEGDLGFFPGGFSLRVFDFSDAFTEPVVPLSEYSSTDPFREVRRAAVEGPTVVIVEEMDGPDGYRLNLIDVSDPGDPVSRATAPFETPVSMIVGHMEIDRGVVFTRQGVTIRMNAAGEADQLQEIGSFNGTIGDFDVVGRYLYGYSLISRTFQVIDLGSCGRCPADLAEPWRVLDLADIAAFAGGFIALDPESDLTGDGVWDLADVQAFVTSFIDGCP
jgi:hypothetical protein